MAYYIYDREQNRVGAFVHIPRTAGTFVRQAIGHAGFHTKMIGYAHQPASVVDEGVFSFAFVRHPETWYPSMFTYELENGWPGENSFPWLGEFGAKDVGEFVEHVARFYPMGYLPHVFGRAIHYGGRRTDFTGRYEHLVRDLARVFRVMGIPLTESDILELPAVNCSGWEELGISERTRRAIHALERDIIREWYE